MAARGDVTGAGLLRPPAAYFEDDNHGTACADVAAAAQWLLTVQNKNKGKKGTLVEWSLEIETW